MRWKRQGTWGYNIPHINDLEQDVVTVTHDDIEHTRAESETERKHKGKGEFSKANVKEIKNKYGLRIVTSMVLGSAMVAK